MEMQSGRFKEKRQGRQPSMEQVNRKSFHLCQVKTGSETIPSSSHPTNRKDLAELGASRGQTGSPFGFFCYGLFFFNKSLSSLRRSDTWRKDIIVWLGRVEKTAWSWEGNETWGGKGCFESLKYPRKEVARLQWRPCESYYKILKILQVKGSFVRL